MDKGTAFNEHLKKLAVLVDKLVSISAPVTQEDQAVNIFGSLPAYFTTIVAALEVKVRA